MVYEERQGKKPGWDFLNKMGRKRHASEYLADSGSVSSASTSKMPSGSAGKRVRGMQGGEGGVARVESVEGWLLLRLIQSTATLRLADGLPVVSPTLALVDGNCRTKKKKEKAEEKKIVGEDSINGLREI